MLRKYLRSRRGVLLLFLVFVGIFAAAFVLYRLPLAAVLYPALLCALIGGGFLLFDYRRTVRRCRELRRITAAADIAAASPLPDTAPPEVRELWAVIGRLCDEANAARVADEGKYRDTVAYFTAWAHQIKTPIAAMKLALQNEDTPAGRRLTADLFRIEQYVGMVMTYLRLGAAQSDYLFRECPLDPLIRQTVRRFAPSFIDRRIRLDYAPADLTVVTDEKWLTFVLEQLLSNALKYTREGGCVRIETEAPGTVRIADDGIGIAPEDLPRVFDEGYTGRNGRTDKSASGIGLYLCKRICTALGADIRIASEVGKGTAVTLILTKM